MYTCKECDWWRLLKDDNTNGMEKGRCHRRAPIGTAVVMPVLNQISRQVTPQIIEVSVWPITGSDCEVCGDFGKGNLNGC